MTQIVSGFPGVGKSYYIARGEGSDYMPQGYAIDLDSSRYNTPENYITAIKEKIGKASIIFISSHKEVREALIKEEIDFTLAYPTKECKIEYIKRYIDRGSPEEFIDRIYKNWDNWIQECFDQKGCTHLVLNKGEYLYNKL